jgi:hypothetical protein
MADDADIALLRAEYESKLYVPGQWVCPKCGFIQGKSFIGAQTGNVWANLAVHEEPCPVDGAKLERLTWEQHATDALKAMSQWSDRAIAAEKQAEIYRQETHRWSERSRAADMRNEDEKRDLTRRLNFLLSKRGQDWLYWKVERGETVTLADVDRAAGIQESIDSYKTAAVPATRCACCKRTDVPMTSIDCIALTLCRDCIDAIDARIKEKNAETGTSNAQ